MSFDKCPASHYRYTVIQVKSKVCAIVEALGSNPINVGFSTT